jgi:hypothetical protein
MSMIWTQNGIYQQTEYENAADLEAAILTVQQSLFGRDRIYIAAKAPIEPLPDGYLLDLSGRKPRLYIVEHRVARRDGLVSCGPLLHIPSKIVRYFQSQAVEAYRQAVKTSLGEMLRDQLEASSQCAEYAGEHGYTSVDHLLESVVNEGPFAALVILDEAPDEALKDFEKGLAERAKVSDEASKMFDKAMAKWINFPVEVLTLTVFKNQHGDRLYDFEPFLEGVVVDAKEASISGSKRPAVDLEEMDTVVVPVAVKRFDSPLVGPDYWQDVRIHAVLRPQIKYLAQYQVAPLAAITHIASVRSIELRESTAKWVVYCDEKAHEIGPIPLVKGGRVPPLSGVRYAKKARLDAATTLDDVW